MQTIVDETTELDLDEQLRLLLSGSTEPSEDQIRSLVVQGASTRAVVSGFAGKKPHFETPLMVCIAKHYLQAMRVLLDLGADPNQMGPSGVPPLHRVCDLGYMDMFNLLVQRGASVHQKDTHGLTPFHRAVQGCHYALLCRLKELSAANANAVCDNFSGDTPLLLALYNAPYVGGKADTVVRWLIDEGADINAPNREDKRPVYEAVRMNAHESLRMLLEQGAQLHHVCPKTGRVALHEAATIGDVEAMRLLLKHDADLDAIDSNGQQVLAMAVAHDRLDVIALLNEIGVDVEHANNQGYTAMHVADQKGDQRLLYALMQMGAFIPDGAVRRWEVSDRWHEARERWNEIIKSDRFDVTTITPRDLILCANSGDLSDLLALPQWAEHRGHLRTLLLNGNPSVVRKALQQRPDLAMVIAEPLPQIKHWSHESSVELPQRRLT